MFNSFALLLAILFSVLTVRRLFIRAFWISTTARITRRPTTSGWEFMGIGGSWADIEYETDEGVKKGKCRFRDSGDSEGVSSPIDRDVFWQKFLGMTIPVYYNATSPDKVVFIGSTWRKSNNIRVTNGKFEDWILASLTVISLLLVIL